MNLQFGQAQQGQVSAFTQHIKITQKSLIVHQVEKLTKNRSTSYIYSKAIKTKT